MAQAYFDYEPSHRNIEVCAKLSISALHRVQNHSEPAFDLDHAASSRVGIIIATLDSDVMTISMSEDVKTVPIADLAPTQLTVGMREVEVRRRRWQEKHCHRAADYFKAKRFPVILGPHARLYLLDRHHLTLALQHEGIWELPVSIVANMSALSFDEFWTTLAVLNWCHPFDDEGSRCSYYDMPTSVNELAGDPYRSLASSLKRAGGYVKDKAPFSEFFWADFLRCRIPRELVESHFGRALALAMNLAQSTEAAALPGWRRNST